ncbi:DnaJ protein,putative [Plasmodium sp. gorilla clade G2]|uniref:DnaJ protein,putative n=1 Tax=Plasmodium sp. gorilla clade G2 TaxID=880535 RepID=UPI000D2CE4E9|nr:DnaJ protein,putative [Plasmodium sp. gorilla clade G2]SOV20036.1 DnaJ protein,putative [Plasmodium sp. gorilla clade G2]
MNMSKKRLTKINVNYIFEVINLFDKIGKNKKKITKLKFSKSLILTTLGIFYIFLLKIDTCTINNCTSKKFTHKYRRLYENEFLNDYNYEFLNENSKTIIENYLKCIKTAEFIDDDSSDALVKENDINIKELENCILFESDKTNNNNYYKEGETQNEIDEISSSGISNIKDEVYNIDDNSSSLTFNLYNSVDRTYYDILNVNEYASLNEIKNNYYNLALEYFLDKNTNNLKRKKEFEKISEAYQILSDKEKREKYNKEGLDVTKNMFIMDPSILFMLNYNLDQLFGYIGKYDITTIINFVTDQFTRGNIFETLVGKSSFQKYGDLIKKMDEKEEERINKLVIFLKDRLQEHVDVDEDTWIVKMEKEIKGLLESKFSCYIIESVGWVYENVSKGYIGKEGKIISMDEKKARKQAKHREQMNRKEAIIWSFRTVSSIGYILSGEPKNHLMIHGVTCNVHNNNEMNNFCNYDDNSVCYYPNGYSINKMFHRIIHTFVKTMTVYILDIIESIVRVVAEKVLYDENDDIKVCLKRAKRMKKLGILMQKLARKKSDEFGEDKVDF